MNRTALIFVSAIALFALPWSEAQSEDDYSAITPDSLVRYISDHEVRIGRVVMDIMARTIAVPGWVNQKKGLVEYLAVTPEGKRHEAVLVLDVQPLHLQTALLLFGLDYGHNLSFQGDSLPPRGDSVEISVAWVSADGDSVMVPAGNLLYDYHDSTTAPTTPWVFTGSMIRQGQLVADLEGSIIATYADPAAVLNNPASARTDDTFYGANEAAVPDPGTPITLIINVPLPLGENK